MYVCESVSVSILWAYLPSLTYLAIYTFQQLSCNGERDALSRDIRKGNQSAWFDQNPLYETIAC